MRYSLICKTRLAHQDDVIIYNAKFGWQKHKTKESFLKIKDAE